MPQIRSLKPNVSREEALRHFSEGAWNRLVESVRGKPQSIAGLYIPYRLFQVKIDNSGRKQTHLFALDAVRGILDLYQFSAPPPGEELLTFETRNVLPANLSAEQARERVLAKIRKQVFSRGFFRLRDVRFDAEPLGDDFCVPYWICFRGSDDRLRLAALDAVRRRAEGAKVRQLVEEWLRTR